MRGYTFLLILLSLPVFGAVGHDIYVTYHDQDFTKAMMFSDVGYLWTHYQPETYAWAQQNLSPETWKAFITPVLEQWTALVAAVPFIFTAVLLLILRLLRLPPFKDAGSMMGSRKKGQVGFGSGDKKQGRFKYKRK